MIERLSDKNRRTGTLLAKGHGVFDMMNTSYNRKLDNNNSTVWVKDDSDLNSYWEIYSKPKKK